MLEFEYDQKKSEQNLAKHGINFEAAQSLWDDPDLLEVSAKTTDEIRFLVIGTINQKYWSAVITYRGKNIRIISVRRSRIEEVNYYES
ncbi:MAG: BrnT family toxin [Cycloclasticus sp.]|nr:BrnT family toxin [Cycloclasticus sp.]